MTEPNTVDLTTLQQQVATLTAAISGLTQQTAAPAQAHAATFQASQPVSGLAGWAQPVAPAMQLSIIGVSVPVEVQTQAGKVRCYLALPPECATNMQVLTAAVTTLLNAGIPVAAWENRQQYGGNRYYSKR